jgi:oxygen-independent coproporphyrinogen-3 oxidase
MGAGAHGFACGLRIANVNTPQEYIERFSKSDGYSFPQTPATERIQQITTNIEMEETLLMGLRLTDEGVSGKDFYQRFDKKLDEVFREEMEDLIQLGLLECVENDGSKYRLTRKGRILSNQVFLKFIR